MKRAKRVIYITLVTLLGIPLPVEALLDNTCIGISNDQCTVTTAAGDSSVGSLRWCLATAGASVSDCRKIKFDIPGTGPVTITLAAKGEMHAYQLLSGNSPRPITITGHGLECDQVVDGCHDVTIRGIRIRAVAEDGITFQGATYNNDVHHVSISGHADEAISVVDGSNKIRIYNSIIGAGSVAVHNEGIFVRNLSNRVVIRRNLIAGTQSRNPECKYDPVASSTKEVCAFYNNIVWDFHRTDPDTSAHAFGARVTDNGKSNVINNYFYSSTETLDQAKTIFVQPTVPTGRAYTSGNVSANGFTGLNSLGTESSPFTAVTGEGIPQSICDMYNSIMLHAGARLPTLDTSDQALLDAVTPPPGC